MGRKIITNNSSSNGLFGPSNRASISQAMQAIDLHQISEDIEDRLSLKSCGNSDCCSPSFLSSSFTDDDFCSPSSNQQLKKQQQQQQQLQLQQQQKLQINASATGAATNKQNLNNKTSSCTKINQNGDRRVRTTSLGEEDEEDDDCRRDSEYDDDESRLTANSAAHHDDDHHLLSPCSAHHQALSAASSASSTPLTDARRFSRQERRLSLANLGYGKAESYLRLNRVGKGTYATVFLGRSRLSNDLIAMKEILKEHDEGAPCTAIREISLLRHLRHANIITLHDVCHTATKLTLVFEYVGPDLYTYIRQNNYLLSVHNVRLLLYQLLRGLSYCHARQILHRDLKPQNLLINKRGELKICDFGLARAKSIPTKSYSNEVVTLWYRPPDVLLGNTAYDASIDMWGVGCVFFELASGRTMFPGSNVEQQLYLIFSFLGAPNKYNWPSIIDDKNYKSYNFPSFRQEKLSCRVPRLDADGLKLLAKFLKYEPSERISADDARYEPFFACLPDQIHHLDDYESIFSIPGISFVQNPGQKLRRM